MLLGTYKDILSAQKNGLTIGFHSKNLELAILPSEYIESVLNPQAPQTHPLQNDTTFVTNTLLALQNSFTKLSSEGRRQLDSWNSEVSTEVKSGQLNFGIKSITLNANQLCNLKCAYCAAGGDGTYQDPVKKISIEKTFPQLKWLIQKLKSGETFGINFLGGEPLLTPEVVWALADEATELCLEQNVKLEMALTTNGTLLVEKNLIELAKRKFNITISLDGTAAVTDLYRPSKNGSSTTEAIVENLEILKKYKSDLGRIRAHAVFHKNHTDVQGTYDFFRTLPIDQYTFSWDHDNADPQDSRDYTAHQNSLVERVFATEGEAGVRRIDFYDSLFHRLDNQERTQNFCGAGKDFLMIDSRNKLYACPWDTNDKNLAVGSDTELDEGRLMEFAGQLTDKADCHSCWARYLCGGGCMYIHKKATGDRKQVDPIFCDRMKSLLAHGFFLYVQARRDNKNDANIQLML